MFCGKYKIRAERAEAELSYAKAQLEQYRTLIEKLKKHDWFEFNYGGGIVAHDKDEPLTQNVVCGKCYIVPGEFGSLMFE